MPVYCRRLARLEREVERVCAGDRVQTKRRIAAQRPIVHVHIDATRRGAPHPQRFAGEAIEKDKRAVAFIGHGEMREVYLISTPSALGAQRCWITGAQSEAKKRQLVPEAPAVA